MSRGKCYIYRKTTYECQFGTSNVVVIIWIYLTIIESDGTMQKNVYEKLFA